MHGGLQRTELPIQVETDCAQLIVQVQTHELDRSRYCSLVKEVQRLLASQREIKLSKFQRSQNSVSHDLANYARSSQRTVCWLGSNPLEDALDVTIL